MRHGSVFTGLGGFDLAATWMGWENVFNCERDRFCRRILKHYWPKTKSHEDIRQFEGAEYRGQIDVLSGGFPCQPFSQAGKRKGTADDRYLWPEMCRIVGEIQPTWVVGENVFGLLNWNGGMVFRQVLTDLEAQGYEVWPYVLPAAGVGAPHRRDRIWFVAHARSQQRGSETERKGRKQSGEWKSVRREFVTAGKSRHAANTDSNECDPGIPVNRQQWETTFADGGDANVADSDGEQRRKGREYEEESKNAECNTGASGSWDERSSWEKFPTESPICSANDGLPGRLDGITFSSWRKESIKAYGNAIVPLVALQIFRAIEQLKARDFSI